MSRSMLDVEARRSCLHGHGGGEELGVEAEQWWDGGGGWFSAGAAAAIVGEFMLYIVILQDFYVKMRCIIMHCML